nr:MAG TPA: hypothetical protein [Caudoviricetes sp.]
MWYSDKSPISYMSPLKRHCFSSMKAEWAGRNATHSNSGIMKKRLKKGNTVYVDELT